MKQTIAFSLYTDIKYPWLGEMTPHHLFFFLTIRIVHLSDYFNFRMIKNMKKMHLKIFEIW